MLAIAQKDCLFARSAEVADTGPPLLRRAVTVLALPRMFPFQGQCSRDSILTDKECTLRWGMQFLFCLAIGYDTMRTGKESKIVCLFVLSQWTGRSPFLKGQVLPKILFCTPACLPPGTEELGLISENKKR